MTLYLDASALVKLVREEPETEGLRALLRRHRGERVTSALARVEVIRAVAAWSSAAVPQARRVMEELYEVRLDRSVLDRAATLPVSVRSLDAVHLACALELGATLTELVTYDRQMAVAADALGVPVVAPG